MKNYKIIIVSAVIFILLLPRLNYSILKNTYEIHQRNMNGASGNVVLLHEEGHQEAVYDSDGNLVTDTANKGSYNFCNPIEEPYCHYKLDTKPWIEFGNGPDDPTTEAERKDAFLKDYWDGLKRLTGLIE